MSPGQKSIGETWASTDRGRGAAVWPHGATAACLTPDEKVVWSSHTGDRGDPPPRLGGTLGTSQCAQRTHKDVQLLSGINVVPFEKDLYGSSLGFQKNQDCNICVCHI